MGVFRAGELLGVDSVTTLKKMAVGEGDPADPEFQAMRQDQAKVVPDTFSAEQPPLQYSSPPPAEVMPASDVLDSLGGSSQLLDTMGEDLKKTVQRLFLQAETASYGLPPSATSSTPAATGSTGGSGGGSGSA